VNLEELVRAALTKQASAEPEEAGAYDRFLRHRRRRAWRAAGSAGLAVALVLALAVGGGWLLSGRHRSSVTGPVATTGMVRYPRQGFALPLPAGWQVDQETTQGYHQARQAWLVLTPIGRNPQAITRITVHTAVTDPLDYPGRPGTPKDRGLLPATQGTSPLMGRRSVGRRADGRAFAVGTQDGLVTYMIAWPYQCPERAPCPPAARWRVLQLDAYALGESSRWPEVQRVVRQLVETVRPITNALPDGPFQPEEPELFGRPLKTIATGGQGDYAWEISAARRSAPQEGYWVEIHFPKFNGMGGSIIPGDFKPEVMCVPHKAGVVFGSGPKAVATVRVELAGRPAVTVPTAGRDKKLPFTVWVLAPLPLDVQVRAAIGLDATGRQVRRSAKRWGVPGAVCRA
jgi:hypothetical protein